MTLRIALFVLAAALSASTIWFGIGPHDEGLMLQAAHRIASGELPYRDFWWNYGPGQPLLLGGLEKVFGESLVPWRVLRVLLDATVALLAFELATRGSGTVRAERARTVPVPVVAWVAVAGAMAFPTGPGPNPAALALAFGALLLAPRHLRAAAVLAGLAAIFRIEIGVAAALGVLIATRRPQALLIAAGVAALGWLPFFVAAPGDLLDQVVGFLGIQNLQRVPFPFGPGDAGGDLNKLLERYVPLILLVGTALYAAYAIARRRLDPLLPLLVVGVAYLLGRTDEFHLVPLAAVLPILLATAYAATSAIASRIAFAVVLGLVAIHGLERKAGELRHRPQLADLPGPAADGIRADTFDAHDLVHVLARVGDQAIFVAPPRFDRVTVGDPLLYVIAGKDNPTRYDVLQPGVVTKADVQREMVADLQKARPPVLIRWHDPRTAPEDNASGRLRGSRILDAYLNRTYRPAARYGVYEVLTDPAARTARP